MAPIKDVKKVVLAYSGGLDTSIILKWLQETYGCEVVTFTADLGHVLGSGDGQVVLLTARFRGLCGRWSGFGGRGGVQAPHRVRSAAT